MKRGVNISLILGLLLVLSVFLLASCSDDCDEDSDCEAHEKCVSGVCKDPIKCYGACNSKSCHKSVCDHSTNYKCVQTPEDGESGTYCMGWYDKSECLVNICREGACVQERSQYSCETDSEAAERRKKTQIPCLDGTPYLECSKLKPGFFCGENGKYEYDAHSCLECSDGTSATECSETDGYYCTEEGNLILDENMCGTVKKAASLINPCSDGTPFNQCSTQKPGYKCVNNELIFHQDCKDVEAETPPEEPQDEYGHSTEACSDGTGDGDCSWLNNGKWCVGGELIDDEFCLDSCEDGTANSICSFNTEGYRCNNKVLVLDETCDFDYVEPNIDCDDGTLDGHCTNAGDGYWCNHGVLEYDASCLT
ncbi:hypothetical protein ACFL1H_02700 [Nanoarchaeota archaeon]